MTPYYSANPRTMQQIPQDLPQYYLPGYGGADVWAQPKHPYYRRGFGNICMAFVSLVLPWGMFSATAAVVSFYLHYRHPWVCVAAVLIGLLICMVLCSAAIKARRQRLPATWSFFLAASCFFSWMAGVSFGSSNFHTNMHPFYDIVNLNWYPNVDVGKTKGNMMMDAGRISFRPDAHVDTSKAIGFINVDTYCVAPITSSGNTTVDSIDFWAVGTNCCGGSRMARTNFNCGEHINTQAHSGLRLMRDDQRSFFRLAVQEAEAAYNITARHPLFFYWMLDPTAEMNAYQDDGYRWFILAVFADFSVQLFLVLVGIVSFSKVNEPGLR